MIGATDALEATSGSVAERERGSIITGIRLNAMIHVLNIECS
jgi:hypothetical protein